MKPKQSTFTQTGFRIEGEVLINCWGGGQGLVVMDPTFIPIDTPITKSLLLSCINDGQFGCESIESAELTIYDDFGKGINTYNRNIDIPSFRPEYHQYFHRGIK